MYERRIVAIVTNVQKDRWTSLLVLNSIRIAHTSRSWADLVEKSGS